MRRSRALVALLPCLGWAVSCGAGQAEPAKNAPKAALDAGAADAALDAQPRAAPTTVIEMKAVVAVTLPRDAVCTHAPGKASPALPGKCHRDTDCTEHAYGRCNALSDRNACTYDECVSDSECERSSPGSICFCSSGSGLAGNRCQRGNCRGDGDCAPGAKCAHENAFTGKTRLDGSFCTTLKDACDPADDARCAASACTYSTAARRWECTPGTTRGQID